VMVHLQIVPMFPVYYIFNFLLSVLQILHIIWTYYIVKIAYKVRLKRFDCRPCSIL